MKLKLGALLAISITAASSAVSAEQAPDLNEMWKVIQQQQTQIRQLQAKLSAAESRMGITETKVRATADAVDNVSRSASGKIAGWAAKTTVGGYGEHHYNNFRSGNKDQIDAHRFVLFFGHEFSDTLRFFSEFELEHGFSGPDNANGEVELEQAYIQWDYAQNHNLTIGQFLIPVGIINETHEPPTFYGVERNNVEKRIIPATWWEVGLMGSGEIAPGLSYDLAFHSGLAIPKKDSLIVDPDTGAVVKVTEPDSGKRAIRDFRQKASKAKAEDFAGTVRIKYTGIAGLELAATYQYQSDLTQSQDGFSDDADAQLWEAHLAYQGERFGLRALYADWDIDGDLFDSSGADQQTGWYIEPSYKITDKLGVFVRYSEWDNQAGLSGSDKQVEQTDFGFNYYLHENVVLKADVQRQDGNKDDDAFNLGVGWQF